MRGLILASTAVAWALSVSVAAAASDTVVYGPPPAWVTPSPEGRPPPQEPTAQFARLADDEQIRFTATAVEHHYATRNKALTADLLGELGNISLEWDPATQTLAVNRLAILRDGERIDLLAGNRFQVLRRERNLEEAMLDGRLTAALQAPDLRVGDTLELAYTVTEDLPLMRGRNATVVSLLAEAPTGASRVRVIWDKAAPVRWRLGANLPRETLTETATAGELTLEATDSKRPPFPEQAPLRFVMADYAQFSQARDWRDVSALLWPLFDKAATLTAASPLKAEAERIKAAAATPEARATLALKLVEQQVRYVAITMDAQGYTPAAADETWRRRFGDCKGKTALLIALLRELGIEAQAMLVTTEDGEALADTLPTVGAFNHVVVKANIAGRSYWLDGTRLGDGPIETLDVPDFAYGLPLAAAGADLERIVQPPRDTPDLQTIVRVDATRGLFATSPVEATVLLRGDLAQGLARSLAVLPRDRAEKALLEDYGDRWAWAEMTSAAWRWEEAEGLLTVTLHGEGELVASDDPKAPHIDLPDGERLPMSVKLRPTEQNQAAPYRAPYPAYYRYVSIIKLPPGLKDAELFGDNLHEVVGGVVYDRTTGWVDEDYVITRKSFRTLTPEITATEAAEAAKAGAAAEEANHERMELHHVGLRSTTMQAGDRRVWSKGRLARLSGTDARLAGRLAYGAKDYDGALAAYQAAAAKGLTDVGLTLDRGQALFAAKRYAEIAPLIDNEQARLGDLAFAALTLKLMAAEAQGGGSALSATLDREIAARPNVGAYALRASSRLEDDPNAAEQDLRAANALPGGGADEYEMLARAYRRAKQPEQAVEAMRRAVRANPEDLDMRLGLAERLEDVARPAEALSAYDEAVRMHPLDATALAGRADMLAVLGRKGEASAQLDAMSSALPYSRDAINSVCWIRATRDLDPAKGLAECDRWLKVFPEDAVLLDTRGFAKLRLGRNAEALADYEQALKLEPEQMDSVYGRGVARIRTGAKAAGEADLAAAEAGAPGIAARWKTYGLTF